MFDFSKSKWIAGMEILAIWTLLQMLLGILYFAPEFYNLITSTFSLLVWGYVHALLGALRFSGLSRSVRALGIICPGNMLRNKENRQLEVI